LSTVNVPAVDTILRIVRGHVGALSDIVPRASINGARVMTHALTGRVEFPFLTLDPGASTSERAHAATDFWLDALTYKRRQTRLDVSPTQLARPFAVCMDTRADLLAGLPDRRVGDGQILFEQATSMAVSARLLFSANRVHGLPPQIHREERDARAAPRACAAAHRNYRFSPRPPTEHANPEQAI
jgi:hypothetical protein